MFCLHYSCSAFKAHVERYHPQGEDFSQAAARIVREATEKDEIFCSLACTGF